MFKIIFPTGLTPNPEEDSPLRLASLLGYSRQTLTDYAREQLLVPLSPHEEREVESIVNELDSIDTAIAEAYTQSQVTSTCDSELNWGPHIRGLHARGSRLLRRLSVIYDIKVVNDKYQDNRSTDKLISYV